VSDQTTLTETASASIRLIGWDQALKWLDLAWKDMVQHPFWSLIHAVRMALSGWVAMGFSLLGVLSLFFRLAACRAHAGTRNWHAYKDLVGSDAWPDRFPEGPR
jgi:hypothetical protein